MPSISSTETTIGDRRFIEIAKAFLFNFGLALTRESIEEGIRNNTTIRDSLNKLIEEKISSSKKLLDLGSNEEQKGKTSVELDHKIHMIRQHYDPARLSKPSTSQSRINSYDFYRNCNLEDLQDYQIQCQCGIPPCKFSPRQSEVLSLSTRWEHCSIHCNRGIDKVNGYLDEIVGLKKDIILLQQEIDLFSPVCSILFIASLFTPILETVPTFILGNQSIDRRLSDQFTTSWLAQAAGNRTAQISRVNQGIYSLVRPLGPQGLFSVIGIVAATLWLLRTEVPESECEVPS